MELTISGIKCDTNHCNYRDDDVKFTDYPQWLNKQCPICESNLLTQKDYDYCLRMDKFIRIINILKWVNPFFYIGSVYRFLKGDKEYNNVQIKYENDGSVTKTEYTTKT